MFSSKITYDRERNNFLFQRVIIPKQEMSVLPVKFKILKRWDEFRFYFKFLQDNGADEIQMKNLFKDSILEMERMVKPKDKSQSTVQSTIESSRTSSTSNSKVETTDEEDFPSQPFDFLFLLEILTYNNYWVSPST